MSWAPSRSWRAWDSSRPLWSVRKYEENPVTFLGGAGSWDRGRVGNALISKDDLGTGAVRSFTVQFQQYYETSQGVSTAARVVDGPQTAISMKYENGRLFYLEAVRGRPLIDRPRPSILRRWPDQAWRRPTSRHARR